MVDEPPHSRIAPSGSERCLVERRFPRFPTELPCLFAVANSHGWNGRVLNLSRGGCAIRSTTPVRKGDHLYVLIFPGPNQAPIETAPSPVRWAIREQFGVEFLTLSPYDAHRLHSYLTLLESDTPKQ